MKIQRNSPPDSGTSKKLFKPSKKSKGTKKSLEKILKNPNSSDSQESIPKQNHPGQPLRKAQNHERSSPRRVLVMKPQMEKRKPDVSERKTLKKIDYQRLETVLEEGQLSSEEAPSKHNFPELEKSDSSSDIDHGVPDGPPLNAYKSWIQSLIPLAEIPAESNVNVYSKKSRGDLQSEQIIKNPLSCDKGKIIDLAEFQRESTQSFSRDLSQSKRGVFLSGMMEILPIFSNDKFYCSRDAISVEECEEAEVDKNTGRSNFDAKKDSRADEIKGFFSANCLRKEDSFENNETYSDMQGDVKEKEKNLRYKFLTENNLSQETSSPFIDSLLVLTPFASEKEMYSEKNLKDNNERKICLAHVNFSSVLAQEEGKGWSIWKSVFCLLISVACVLLMVFSIAWNSYQPPCIVDYVLDMLPFVHHRRSYFELFFDKLLAFLSNILGDQCINFSFYNQIFDFTVF